jgi:hypothetical protein
VAARLLRADFSLCPFPRLPLPLCANVAWGTAQFAKFAGWFRLHFDTSVTLVRWLIHDERETLIHHVTTITTTKQTKATLSILIRVPGCAAEPPAASILVWLVDFLVEYRPSSRP